MTLLPEDEPERLPELTVAESERLLNDVMDALHRARLYPARESVAILCSHRMDDGQRIELLLQPNDADLIRTKGLLMKLAERL